MVTHTQGSLSLLLISCVLSTSVSLPVLAAGDGVIVVKRPVEGHMAGRTAGVDPYPTTVNANPSAQVLRAANSELNDSDIAGISSGASITRTLLPNGNLPGLAPATAAGLGAGGSVGHGSGAGSSIAGTVNGAVSRSLAPLNTLGNLTGGR